MARFYCPFKVESLPCSPNWGTLFNPNGITWYSYYASQFSVKNLKFSDTLFNASGKLSDDTIIVDNTSHYIEWDYYTDPYWAYDNNYKIYVDKNNEIRFKYWFWDAGKYKWYWSTEWTAVNSAPDTEWNKPKYNGLDGYNWSRVKLANGTQGYLVSDYVKDIAQSNYTIGYVNCNPDGLVNIRSGVGTNHSIVASLPKGTKVTVLQKNAGAANGFNWDKIVVGNGLEGYIANAYMQYEETKPVQPKPEEPKPAENTNTNAAKVKVDGTNILTVPDAKVSDIKAIYSNAVCKCGDTVMTNDAILGTGNIVTAGDLASEPDSDQPSNVYPFFIGLLKVISFDSIL